MMKHGNGLTEQWRRMPVLLPALILIAFTASPVLPTGQETVGRVRVVNRTTAEVQVHLDHWVKADGTTFVDSGYWTVGPGARIFLQWDGVDVYASSFGYRIKTSEGATPEESGKVWIARHQGGALFAIDIVNSRLPRSKTGQPGGFDAKSRARIFLESPERISEILSFAHPTATLNRYELAKNGGVERGGELVPGAFYLRYNLYWTGSFFGDRQKTSLLFLFDRNGKLTEVQSGGSTSPFQPFDGSNLIIEFFKEMVRQDEDIRRDPKLRATAEALMSAADAKGMLEFILRLNQP